MRFNRRILLGGAGIAGLAAAGGDVMKSTGRGGGYGASHREPSGGPGAGHDNVTEARIARALRSGPPAIRDDAKVVEMGANGRMTVLREGTNGWTCMPGVETASADMCADQMGMRWMLDVWAGKPKPTNTSPGLIYMLNGAMQHSFTDPFDHESPLIPIGPHWMVLWPFTAERTGLSTVMRDAGTMIMFAGTPYAHLHICGDPWAGNEYHRGLDATWTMTYRWPHGDS